MEKSPLRLFFILTLVFATLFAGAQSDICSSGYKTEFKIPYCTVDGKTLTLNAFLPANNVAPAPVMIDIHGGWWFGGGAATQIQETFTKKGIAVFSIEYRLGEEGGFPQNIRDCRNAVRFVRKNAARFNIDPDRIGCMGGSAGGHLSLMVAMVPEDFDDGGPTSGLEGISARVSNCFGNIAPTDFVRFWNEGPDDLVRTPDKKTTYRKPDAKIPNDSRPRLRVLFHGVTPDTKKTKALYAHMSPVGNIHKGIPPLLICDGEKDPIVPGLEGKELNDKLQAAGIIPTYWMTVNGGHTNPGGKGFQAVLDNFLVKTLAIDTIAQNRINADLQASQCLFRNPNLSFEERVNDLVGRLTLAEKISQMVNRSPAIPRLRIPAYNWWNECLHGVGRSGIKVTVFPQAIGMAATFDDEALLKMASITSDEARAINEESNRTGHEGQQYRGLTFWTPNINIFRDPRWGRGQETYGEDPYLTSRMGTAMVHGLQGDDPKYLKASACAKHYAVHSGPEPGRNKFNVVVSNYDLWDTYLPAFHALVADARVSAVMCAYNRYDGQPCCGNDLLMTNILRKQWGFTGYVTSDCGAVEDFFRNHKTQPDAASAAADAVLHGTDLECGGAYRKLGDAVKNNQITEKDIDVSVKRLFMTRFRLGMFDPREIVPYSNIPMSLVECKAHQEHALKMARESMVLLKNQKHILPFSKSIKRIVVIGPNADNPEIQLGNYNGFPTNTITPLKGIQDKNRAEVTYMKGTEYVAENKDAAEKALKAVAGADVVVFVGGISPRLEGEDGDAGKDGSAGFFGGDRTNISLPTVQTDLMKRIKLSGVPLVFVCMSGSAIGFEWEAKNADAILQAWYGGQSAGTAIADVLFGDYNPAGRLPVTFYKSTNDLPPISDYSMTNRTYRYYKGEPLYSFGFGLSYTNFSYQWVRKPQAAVAENDTISFSVKVKNTGKMDGEEVVQAYIQYPRGKGLPINEMRQFQRIRISQNGEQYIAFKIPVSAFQKWDESQNGMKVYKGDYHLSVGANAADRKLVYAFKIE